MSATQNPSTPSPKLEDLECHFTWDLDSYPANYRRRLEYLKDIGTEEGNSWLGHIKNLQGYIHYQLGHHDDAHQFFSEAAEGFRRAGRGSEDGPWLIVNYGNLAWLHHHQGQEEESQEYLSMVAALLDRYPPPTEGELHPEICAEKAWNLMEFGPEKQLQAIEYFERALEMQPDLPDCLSSQVMLLLKNKKYIDGRLNPDIVEKLRRDVQLDPENTRMAVEYIRLRGEQGEDVKDEVQEMAARVLENPVSSYGGLKPLLRVYRNLELLDEAIDLAEEALENHPDERYLKRCAALCYYWRIVFRRESRLSPSQVDRAVLLHKEVISLYPHSCMVKKTNLANIYANSGNMPRAEQIFQELIQEEMEPAELQVVYNQYAKCLYFGRKKFEESIRYHQMAAMIPIQSFHRKNSIYTLRKLVERGRTPGWQDIQEFLENLEEPEEPQAP